MDTSILPIIGHASEWLGGMLVYGVVSSAVRALPDPDQNSSKGYVWFFRFTNAVMTNWDKVQSSEQFKSQPKG